MTAEPPTGLEAKLDGILVHMVSGLTASLAPSVASGALGFAFGVR
jgi:hypothetical protein